MLNTSLKGRLRNTSLPKAHGLLPLFEAVVNSIQSIESAGDPDGRIEVEVLRSPQAALDISIRGRIPQEPIVGIRITDNGVGFNSDNMSSFETLDSEFKIDQGCRGVGRLVWLKAFDRVEITSAFKDGDDVRWREITFTERGIDQVLSTVESEREIRTQVHLSGFKEGYQKGSRKLANSIAKDLLEHCFWYFVRPGGAPKIIMRDGDETIDLDLVYDEYMRSASQTVSFTVKGQDFDLVHLKLQEGARPLPTLNWCAANRVVVSENLRGKINGLHGSLRDKEGGFMYAGYLTSKFLDDHVRSERTDFDMVEGTVPTEETGEEVVSLFDEQEPTRIDISLAAIEAIAEYLDDSLEQSARLGRQRVERFVESQAPRYRPILKRIDDSVVTIDPSLSDRDLELELHKQFYSFENEVLREGQEVLSDTAPDMDPDEYDEKLQSYLDKVEDAKKSDLAAYVSRRRLILELLKQAIELQADDRYSREDRLHRLIMPMRATSSDSNFRANNLWIIDERLAFHDYLGSDKTIRSAPITASTSLKEPDLLGLHTFDRVLLGEGESPRWASLSIVEIKRPMRDDARARTDKDPVMQTLEYLEEVREGGVTTSTGRTISNADRIPAFCYIIADLTKSMRAACKANQLEPTDDGLGYFGYHRGYNAYVEVISFDRLLDVARRRNRAFFDVLGLPA